MALPASDLADDAEEQCEATLKQLIKYINADGFRSVFCPDNSMVVTPVSTEVPVPSFFATESIRWKARSKKKPHSAEYLWTHCLEDIKKDIKDSYFDHFMDERSAMARSLVYNSGNVAVFSTAECAAIICCLQARELLPPKFTWFDPSMGWGDRLSVACALDSVAGYLGIDPNPYLFEDNAYPRIKRVARKMGIKKRLQFVKSGAEDFRLHPADVANFDLVLTSPPFFDQEIYLDESDPKAATQSIVKFKTLAEWIDGFFVKYLLVGYRALRPGGVMALHMFQSTVVEPWVQPGIDKFLKLTDAVVKDPIKCTKQKGAIDVHVLQKPKKRTREE